MKRVLIAAWIGMALMAAADEPACVLAGGFQASTSPVVAGDDGWLFLASELRFINAGRFWGEDAVDTGRAFNPAHRDPLEPIDDFNRQLSDRGIKLLIVPVPPKALIYPAPLGCSREDLRPFLARLREFYAELRERGIEVLDLSETFVRPEHLASGLLYPRSDSHWSSLGARIAAERVAEWITAQAWSAEIRGTAITPGAAHALPIVGDLTRLLKKTEPETIDVHPAALREQGLPAHDPASPILILGDRHVLIYHEGADAPEIRGGFADHLAAALGRPLEVVGVPGSGATASRIALIRRINANPGEVYRKKLIVWCFAASEFTEADAWRFVPLPVR